MTFDPRRRRINTIMATIKQNPYVKNKNSMLGPLYDEVVALRTEVARLEGELVIAKAPKPQPKKEKKDGDATTE